MTWTQPKVQTMWDIILRTSIYVSLFFSKIETLKK